MNAIIFRTEDQISNNEFQIIFKKNTNNKLQVPNKLQSKIKVKAVLIFEIWFL
jgi:hypothetical protein